MGQRTNLIIIILVAILSLILLTSILIYSNDNDYTNQQEQVINQPDTIVIKLINSVDNYIRSVAPESRLNSDSLVNNCLKYNVDIVFVLAQGQLESSYGTKGLASRTNSVWNTHAFDGYSYERVNSKGKFSSPDDSIEPYLRLLCTCYLVEGRTESDMMMNYVDYKGDRYASDKNYEHKLSSIYHRINNNTDIGYLSKKVNKVNS